MMTRGLVSILKYSTSKVTKPALQNGTDVMAAIGICIFIIINPNQTKSSNESKYLDTMYRGFWCFPWLLQRSRKQRRPPAAGTPTWWWRHPRWCPRISPHHTSSGCWCPQSRRWQRILLSAEKCKYQHYNRRIDRSWDAVRRRQNPITPSYDMYKVAGIF